MIGVVIISHGEMAQGIKNALQMFFGEQIKGLQIIGLAPDKSVDSFYQDVQKAYQSVEEGNGVLVFADLYGGTPFNQALRLLKPSCQIITGMNLGMIMDFLVTRETVQTVEELCFDKLLEVGRQGIRHVQTIEINQDSEDL